MRKFTVGRIWIPAFLLAAVLVGCGDPDKNAGTGKPGEPLSPPTVTSVTPPDSSAPACASSVLISATFSKPMNPATINASTFTVALAGSNVSGQVSYVAATNTATFTPAASLAPSTSFTATITTGANDTFGNPLAANFVWTFTTSAPCPPPAPSALGAACTFGILAGTTVTNTGATIIRGDVGLSPGSAVTGFLGTNTYVGTGTHSAGPGIVTGTIHLTDPPPASTTSSAAAQTALTTAYLDLKGRTIPAPATVAGDLGGLTLTLGSSNIVLAGQAQARNVFWQVGSSATLGTNSTFNGSILALTDITLTTGATLNGRALAQNGAVTLDTNMVNVPACP